MSSISIAAQRFASLLPSGPQPSDPVLRSLAFPGDRICECLELDVVPAAQRLFTSPAFQELARQPLITLLPGCDTPEQRLIEKLKQAITEAARAVETFIHQHREMLDSTFVEAVARWRRLKHVRVACDSVECIELPPLPPSLDEALAALRSAQAYCGDVWASAEDYFGPRFETFFQDEDGQWHQRGEFIIAFNPNLQIIGNFVARCLMVRATTAFHLVESTTQELKVALNAANSRVPQPWHEPQRRIERLLADLRSMCLTLPEAVLVESVIGLVQIVAELAPNKPDLTWLAPASDIYAPYGNVRRALQSQRDPIAGQLVRAALETIERWSKRRTQFETDIDEAIATGGLVVVEATRHVYWKGELLKVDWLRQDKPWKLLLALARKRGLGFLSEFDFYGEQDVTPLAYSQAKSRLKNLLPTDLSSGIKAVKGGEKAYQLCLPSKLIHVFSISTSAAGQAGS